jgi:hypothetical protein
VGWGDGCVDKATQYSAGSKMGQYKKLLNRWTSLVGTWQQTYGHN